MNRLASPAQLRASLLRWSLFTIPAIILLGFFSGMAAGSGEQNPWFAGLVKPAIYPPPVLFPIAWTILYVLLGLSLALVCAAWGARLRPLAILAFVVQFALNLAWSPVFFAAHLMSVAFYIICGMILLTLVTMILFGRVRKLAAWLMVPYMMWICFAAVLNWQIWHANPAADGAATSYAVQRVSL